jgi:GPH family glycoside/pentoside/hexuronide:cation symporter
MAAIDGHGALRRLLSFSDPPPPPPGATPPRLGLPTMVMHCIGSAATGIKQRTLAALLLIYYNQVIGLPPAAVGAALSIIAIFDSLCDPVVGQVSDNLRHPWGRRHPFMYLAALPVAVAFYLVWNPPVGLSHEATLVWLVSLLLIVRLFDTFFELPTLALIPELTNDYQKRTQMAAIRAFCTNVAGLGALLAAFQFFMAETPDGAGGVTDRAGYATFSLVFAAAIAPLILISTASTHRFIPFLHRAPKRTVTLSAMFREVGATLNNRSFAALVCASLLLNSAIGVYAGLDIYFSLYFWELPQTGVALLTVVQMVATGAGALTAPVLSRAVGKRAAMMIFGLLTALFVVGPVSLRLLGLMPENGHPSLFPIIALGVLLHTSTLTGAVILVFAMMNDVVEDAEVKTGRRSEGLLISADNLLRKMVSSVGVFASGLVLTISAFPQKAVKGQVPDEVLRTMGMTFVPLIFAMFMGMVLALCFYRLSEARHRENLRILAERRARGDSGERSVVASSVEPGNALGAEAARP